MAHKRYGHKIPPLTDAQRDLAAANVGLAFAYVRRHAWRSSLSPDDLLSACFEGIMYAARRFDPATRFKFSSYATRWMRSKEQRAIRPDDPFDIPSHAKGGKARNEDCRVAAARARASRREQFMERVGVTSTACDEVDDAEAFAAGLALLEACPRLVIERRLAGRKLWEIGREIGKSGETVRVIERDAIEVMGRVTIDHS